MRSLQILSIAALICGCSNARPGEFPSRAELAAIGDRPAIPNLFPKTADAGESWTLAGALPEAIEVRAYEGTAPVDVALRDFAARRPGLVFASTSMHCAAEETARFFAERGGRPPRDVERFIAARCGAANPAYTYSTVTLPIGPTDDATSMQRLAAEAPKAIAQVAEHGNTVAGVAIVRGAKLTALVAASQPRHLNLEPVPLVPQNGRVVLRGEVLEPVSFVRALVNKGAFGYGECEARKDVRLPAFEITCEVLPTDDFAWVELVAVPPGRILGHAFVEAMVFPKGALTPTFTPVRRDEGRGQPSAHAIVDALNARRGEAGLAPVTLDLPESGVISKVVPQYFAAASGRASEIIADKVILGVQAGWDVDGMVRTGESASVISYGGAGPQAIVDRVLESPSKREALFGADVRRVAVGLVVDPESQALGALFGSYALVDPSRHEQEAVDFVARLTKLRAARGLPPPIVEAELGPLASKAARAVERGATTDDALKELMSGAAAALHSGVRGVCIQGESIEKIAIPNELVAAPELRIALAVGHHKDDGPHTLLAVMLVMANKGPTANSARRAHSPSTL